MKKFITLFISFISIIIICYSQTNEIININKNHSNKFNQLDILEQSIKNLKSDKNYYNGNLNDGKVVNLAETSVEYIILNEAIANIFKDEELKKLICCGSSIQNQLSKDKILVDNNYYQDKKIN